MGVTTGDMFDVECTLGTLGASQTLINGSGQTETVSLIFAPLEGGEVISIAETSLILAATQSFS